MKFNKKILLLFNTMKDIPAGLRHYKISKQIATECLRNLACVPGLIFDNNNGLTEMEKADILFFYSKEGAGCHIWNSPRWAEMMRDYIIPRKNELPGNIYMQVHWYQSVHGL